MHVDPFVFVAYVAVAGMIGHWFARHGGPPDRSSPEDRPVVVNQIVRIVNDNRGGGDDGDDWPTVAPEPEDYTSDRFSPSEN